MITVIHILHWQFNSHSRSIHFEWINSICLPYTTNKNLFIHRSWIIRCDFFSIKKSTYIYYIYSLRSMWICLFELAGIQHCYLDESDTRSVIGELMNRYTKLETKIFAKIKTIFPLFSKDMYTISIQVLSNFYVCIWILFFIP